MKRDAKLAVSAIKYRTDLVAPESPEIMLGMVVQVRTPKVTVLGLFARNSLTAAETAKLDGLARIQLQNPFKYLERQCGEEFAADGTLAHLASKHGWALNIEEPLLRDLPASLVRIKRPETLIHRALDWLFREAKKGKRESEVRPVRRKTRRVARTTNAARSPRRSDYTYTIRVHGSAMHA